jgi:iron complex transport system ATP-binding protein
MMILARALCQQADVMLLDEPVTGLDIKHQVNIMGTVKRLAKQRGISVVCVLHDLNLAFSFCDELALLSSGEVYAEGAPDEVLTKRNIESVYGTGVTVLKQDGKTYILPEIHL